MKPARRKPTLTEDLVEGLAKGADAADVPGVAQGIGEGLVRVSEAILPKGKFACPVAGCKNDRGFASPETLRHHMYSAHPGMGDRERYLAVKSAVEFAADAEQRAERRRAMNGNGRTH